ncbi:MAG: histidine kinase dimerization/phospho-acceptor domain-containing protein, partial [Ruminococcus sp.]|nr:histidine kinase dimerization/phospho-acceptor domain-containing protein [Ruminococcus sp.]
MKLTKKVRSVFGRIPLKFSVWLYFLGFTVLVFVLLWLFQILFLEKFYSQTKIKDVEKASNAIIASYNSDPSSEFSEKLTKIASENDLCIEVSDRFGRSLYTKEYSVTCIIHGRENSIYDYQKRINYNVNNPIWIKVNNPRNNCSTVLYGCVLGSQDNPNGYLLINTTLVPVGSTVTIIKRQLMIITIILLIIAFFISLIVSQRIARPIDSITEAAESLAKGNFDTKFDGRGYLEVKKLAETLTYAEKELSRVDTMQRDLIANVSHDLRTPLTMLKAYAEMIRDLSGDNPVKRNE